MLCHTKMCIFQQEGRISQMVIEVNYLKQKLHISLHITDRINLFLFIYIIVYSFSRNCGRYDQWNQPLLCLHSLHVCLRHTNHAMDCSPHLALLLLHDCLDHSMWSNVLWIIGRIFYRLLCSRDEGASIFGMKSWLNWCFQITNDRILRFNVRWFTFLVFSI